MKSFRKIKFDKFNISDRRRLLIILVIIAIGVGILGLSNASTTSTSLEPELGTKSSNIISDSEITASGNKSIKFSGVRRFFADDASWNKTVAELGGEYTALKTMNVPNNDFAKRLWDYGGGTVSGAPPGSFYLSLKDYSVPIYDINTATTTARVYQVGWATQQQSFSFTGMKVGDTIPWNPNWKPGTGNDGILQFVNFQTGKVYGIWAFNQSPFSCIDFIGLNAQNGFDPSNPNHLCIAAINTYDNLYTASDSDNTTSLDRGMGINKLALVVRADEVASGAIRHALPLTTSNPMFGAGSDTLGVTTQPVYGGTPPCINLVSKGIAPPGTGMIAQQFNPLSSPSEAGFSKGFYLKPATRLEHEFGYLGGTLTNGCVTPAPTTDVERSKTNPSGMRFALNITYDEIDSWVASKTSWSAEKKKTAKVFARAWKDYGAIIAETGGYGIGIETDGVVDPISRAKWESLGLPADNTNNANPVSSHDIFDGLLTRDRLYVVKPPQ